MVAHRDATRRDAQMNQREVVSVPPVLGVISYYETPNWRLLAGVVAGVAALDATLLAIDTAFSFSVTLVGFTYRRKVSAMARTRRKNRSFFLREPSTRPTLRGRRRYSPCFSLDPPREEETASRSALEAPREPQTAS
jgi:hypothetical protein